MIIFKKYLDIRFYMANGDELHLQIFEDLRRQITDCVTLISSDEFNNNALDL